MQTYIRQNLSLGLRALLACVLLASVAPVAAQPAPTTPTPTPTSPPDTALAAFAPDDGISPQFACPGARLGQADLPRASSALDEATAVQAAFAALTAQPPPPLAPLAASTVQQASSSIFMPFIRRPFNVSLQLVSLDTTNRNVLAGAPTATIVDYRVRLVNTGAQRVSARLDFAQRCASGLPGCLESIIGSPTVALEPNQAADVTVSVTVPANPPGGTGGLTRLRAQVSTPVAFQATLDLLTTVQAAAPTATTAPTAAATAQPSATAEPGTLGLDLIYRGDSRELLALPGTTLRYGLRVTNLSDVPVGVNISVLRSCNRGIPGCGETFSRSPVFQLAARASYDLTLQVQIPRSARDGQVGNFTVSANIDSNPSIGDVLFLAANVVAPTRTPTPGPATEVDMDLGLSRSTVARGGFVILDLRIRNTGAGDADETRFYLRYDSSRYSVRDFDSRGDDDWVSFNEPGELNIRFGALREDRSRTARVCLQVAPSSFLRDGTRIPIEATFRWYDAGDGGWGSTNTVRITVRGDAPFVSLSQSAPATVQGAGFAPGEPVHVWQHTPGSAPVQVQTITAQADGTAQATQPAESPPGATALVFYGAESGHIAAGLLRR